MDHRDARHGNSQMWNHASTSGQPSPHAPEQNGLKPLSPLRAMPGTVQPQTQARPAPARPVTNSPQPAAYPGAGGTPTAAPLPAWEPAANRPPQTASQPVMQPTPVPYPGAGATPVPVWDPAANRSPQPAQTYGTPNGVSRQTRQPLGGTPPQGWTNGEPAQPYRPASPGEAQETPPVRRIWNQTVAQGMQQTQNRPQVGDAMPDMASIDVDETYPSYGESTRRRRTAPYAGRDAVSLPERTAAGDAAPAAPHTAQPEPARDVREPSARHNRAEGSATAQSAPYTAQNAASRAASYPTPGGPAPQVAPAQDALDDDSGRFDAVANTRLADPVPVPLTESYQPKRRVKRKKRTLPLVLVTLAGVVGIAAGLYYTGLWNQIVQAVSTSSIVNVGIPAIFGQSQTGAAGTATIAPATQTAAVELISATVEPATAAAPATLSFSAETNAATSSVRLLTESGEVLHITAYGTPRGDGLLWQITAQFDQAYTGKVRFFLRDQEGTWVESTLTCDVNVT